MTLLVWLELARSLILIVFLGLFIRHMFQTSYDRRQQQGRDAALEKQREEDAVQRQREIDELKQTATAIGQRTEELIAQNTNITQVAADASAAAVQAANHVNEKIAEIATGIKLDNAQKEQDLQRRIEDDARRTKDDERRIKDDKRRDT